MTKEEIKRVLEKHVKKAWVFILVMIFGGLILFIVARTLMSPYEQSSKHAYPFWYPIMENIGHTIIVAGFFAAFLKSFQFLGVFREEIAYLATEDPVFRKKLLSFAFEGEDFSNAVKTAAKKLPSDPEMISQLHDLIFSRSVLQHVSPETRVSLWRNLTQTLYNNLDEKIVNDKILTKILDSFIPDEIDYIKKNAVVHYTISLKDKHVVYLEDASFDLVPVLGEIDFESSYMVTKASTADNVTNVTVKSFTINKDAFEHCFKPVESDEYPLIKEISFAKKLGPEKVRIKSLVETTVPVSSPHWRSLFAQYTLGFRISITNLSANKINVGLQMIDDRLNLEQILLTLPEKGDENALFFPTDGYMLLITPTNGYE